MKRQSNRYRDAGELYLFGVEPSCLLAHRAALLQDSQTAVSVADGDGRNAVWLAEQEQNVTAVEVCLMDLVEYEDEIRKNSDTRDGQKGRSAWTSPLE